MTGRVLVTGATGFLGSHLVRRLLSEGLDVRALVRRPDRLGDLSDLPGLEVAEGDVLDVDSLQDAVSGISQVYHCAAFVGFGGKSEVPPMMAVNVQGTANVVDAALRLGVSRVVHTSSIAALGRSEGNTDCLDEGVVWTESPLNTAYARSKHLAELEVHRAIAEGLDAVLVNPSLIMGPGRSGENTTVIAEKIRDGKLPAIPSGATNVVDVEDVAEGHVAAMRLGVSGERYILAGENLSWDKIIRTLADAFGVDPPRRRVSMRAALLLGALSEFGATITRRKPLMTRESARVTGHRSCYRNDRARSELGVAFRPFSETAGRLAEALS
ncbi:MAG: SDR family oxidoreductase [Rhodothermales bacterium]|nr:SDR family oxidoreductase [Rhodothermales bacterium]